MAQETEPAADRETRHPVSSASDIPAEREPLLDRIHTTMSSAGGRLLIVGDPGIGKTTLMEQAARHAKADGVHVLYARASEAQSDQPFHGLIDLLSRTEDALFDELPRIQREAVEVALARREGTRDMPPMVLPAAAASLMTHLLRERHVALVVDDLPWLDMETASLLQYVLDRPAENGRSPSLVATQRLPVPPGADRMDWSLLPREGVGKIIRSLFTPTDLLQVSGVELPALGNLIARRLGEPVSESTLEAIYASTQGNPMWAMELAYAQGTSHSESPDLHLPPSIADLVLSYVKSLPDHVLEVLSIVGAMGSAPLASVRSLLDDREESISSAIDTGVVKEVAGRLRPAHPLWATAALELLPARERRQLHRRIAAMATSMAERAHHSDRGAAPGEDEDVALILCLASREARAQGATTSALDQAERSLLRSPADSPNRDHRIVAIAELALAVGDFARARDVLAPLDLSTLELPLVDRAMPILFDAIMGEKGEEEQVRELHHWSLKMEGSPLRVAMLAAYYAEAGSFGSAERVGHAERALKALLHQLDLPISTHRAMSALVQAKLDSGQGFDYELLARAAALEDRLSLVAASDSALACQGFFAFQAGDLDASRTALRTLVQQTEESGDRAMSELFRVYLATVELYAGRTDLAAEILAVFDTSDHPWTRSPVPSMVRVRGLLAISQADSTGLDDLLQLPHGTGPREVGRFIRLALQGIHAARTENWQTAVPLLEEARDLAEARGLHEPGRRMWIDVDLFEAHVALNQFDKAAATLEKIRGVVELTGHPLMGGLQLRLRGMLAAAEGDLPEAEKLITSSIDLLSRTEFRLEQARALLELGRVLRRRRARHRADKAMEQAMVLAEEIQDQPLQTRIRRRLQPRNLVRAEDLLTPSESQVATAVVQGLANKEIAASQFISVRTVEAHLTNIYRKLGVRTRGQLAVRLRDLSDPSQRLDS